jgi:quercetin dioxygenase-like cupin family protein
MPLPTTGPRISPADETIHLGSLTIRFLTTGNDTNASLALFELTVPAAERLGAPPHSHDHYEETIYGIEGVLTWIVDGTPIDVRPGQALPIRRGAVHRFENNGDVDARALCLITPARIGPEFFRESAEVINAAIDGKPDRMQLVAIMLRYGLKPVLPPQAPE